jgi:predicted MFS family arabinose efflux permease
MAAALGVLSVLLLAQFSSASADLGATTSFIVLLRNCGGALGVSATLGVYDDYGLVPTLWVLAAVALIGVLPLMHLPSRLQEVAMGRAS